MTSFAAQIEEWVRETEERMLAVTRDALNTMVNDMQLRERDGGRMRIDTGFLRLTGKAALNAIPSGPSQKPAGVVSGQYTGELDTWDGDALLAVLMDMKLGDTFYWGWTAAYAPVRNNYDGFMDIPVQNWQGYINTSTKKLRDRVRR